MYLAKGDKENIILLTGVEGAIKEVLDEFEKYNRPKDWLTPLRHARTWVKKVNDNIVKDVTEDEKKKIYKLFKQYNLVILPSVEAKAYMEDSTKIVVEEEVWGNLAEVVLESQCKGCNKQDFKACKFRSALSNAGVPAFDPEAKGCQYRYER